MTLCQNTLHLNTTFSMHFSQLQANHYTFFGHHVFVFDFRSFYYYRWLSCHSLGKSELYLQFKVKFTATSLTHVLKIVRESVHTCMFTHLPWTHINEWSIICVDCSITSGFFVIHVVLTQIMPLNDKHPKLSKSTVCFKFHSNFYLLHYNALDIVSL